APVIQAPQKRRRHGSPPGVRARDCPLSLVYIQPPVADSWGVARILGTTLLVQPGPFFPSVEQGVLPPSSPPSPSQVHTQLCFEKLQRVPDHEL
ncbi:unnamed protein product, partial [Gulo gulo]